MAKYYFDIHDGKVATDRIGADFTSTDDVREHMRHVMFDASSKLALWKDAVQLRVNVRDSHDNRVYTGTLLFLIEEPH